LSFEAPVESTVFLVESVTVVEESVFTVVESVVVVVLEEPLHAANEQIAKIANNFFIVICLFMNELLLIPGLRKSNLSCNENKEQF
jgi:hypothetical protein